MRKVRLDTKEGRAAFAKKFADRTPNPLPDALLRQADVIGFLDGDALVGGFLMNEQTPYRYAYMIPETYRVTPHVRQFLDDELAVELICMWLDRAKMTPLKRTRIYVCAVLMAVTRRRRWVLAGSVSEQVASLHKRGFRHMVYCGPTAFPGQPYGEIYAARPYELILKFPSGFLSDLVNRALRRRRDRSRVADHS